MADFTSKLKPRYNGTLALESERRCSDIDVQELARHLLSRDDFLRRQEKVLEVLRREKIFSKEQQMNLSRPERYCLGLARAKAIQRLVRREGWNGDDYRMAEYLNDEMSPYHLHGTMFGILLPSNEDTLWLHMAKWDVQSPPSENKPQSRRKDPGCHR